MSSSVIVKNVFQVIIHTGTIYLLTGDNIIHRYTRCLFLVGLFTTLLYVHFADTNCITVYLPNNRFEIRFKHFDSCNALSYECLHYSNQYYNSAKFSY